MVPIIAGRFESRDHAYAAAALLQEYVDKSDICIFFNNPAGQHAVTGIGGDEKIDSGSEKAHDHSIATGIAAGIIAGSIGAIGGPIVAITAAGVAAYTGSLAGAMHGMKNEENMPESRHSGIILAAHVANPENADLIISTLKSEGAEDIERAQGEWIDGDWADFDPVSAPHLDKDMGR